MRGFRGHELVEVKRDPLEGELRHSYGCVKETDMVKLKRDPKVKRMIESQLGRELRKFAVHDLKRFDKKKIYVQKVLVDMVTGTMYDFMSGECMSSTRIRIID